MRKIAVVLFNLGGPDAQESIRPFLKNFFMDKNIITAPWPVRFFLSELISRKRSKKEAGKSYGLLGHKSPLLENTKAQAAALENALNDSDPSCTWKTFTCMRYWHPMSDAVTKDVQSWQPDEIVMMPLYPQFSTTTSWSSFEDWHRAAAETGLSVATRTICCYPFNYGFIEASAHLIRRAHDEFIVAHPNLFPRVLFSAHGLPEKIIEGGDPYQWQCEQSAKAIAEATGIANLDWQICYQSRVGRLKWIGPSTDEALRRAAKDNVPVIIYPHAFVSEHVETLVEIEIEYRHLAEQLGVPGFVRVPTVSTAPEFIAGLVSEVMNCLNNDSRERICPQNFIRCYCQQEMSGCV
ncbi:MAG: Ferrochelatase, protoheme ferro-lyase [Micavibrio sp.]|nr:Ferrochelatase, protoheme ferro-lyase [Micavibrio sp.]